MNITEFKLDALKRGFVINEKITNASGIPYIETQIQLHDMDGLFVFANHLFPMSEYGSENHIDVLRQITRQQENQISMRHSANPNICNHEPLNLPNGGIVCAKCMAKLGQRIAIELKYN